MKNIVITGNIGAGKSTIVKKLSKDLINSTILHEPVEENVYIDEFYKVLSLYNNNITFFPQMNEISLKMQLFLHYFRLTQQFQMLTFDNDYVIQDRYLYDQLVFSQVMAKNGMMSVENFNLFRNIFDKTLMIAKEIDVLIYLQVSPENLMSRIKQRNRDCEKDITIDYITQLNKQYNMLFDDKLPNVKNQYVIDYNYISSEKYNSILDIIK